MTPDEIARASAEAMLAADRATRGLGIELVAVAPGSATMAMTVRADMTNGHDICHGGFLFTLADSAFAFACNSYGQRVVASHAAISFLAPAHTGDRLTATAREVYREGRSGLYDIRVTRDDGTVIAEFRGQSRTIPGSHIPEAP
mgnify:CR=1 FL=1